MGVFKLSEWWVLGGRSAADDDVASEEASEVPISSLQCWFIDCYTSLLSLNLIGDAKKQRDADF